MHQKNKMEDGPDFCDTIPVPYRIKPDVFELFEAVC